MTIRFTIPCKPLQWSRPEQGRKHRYNKASHSQYLTIVGNSCKQAMKASGQSIPLFFGPVNVCAVFIFPYPKHMSKNKRREQGAHWNVKKPDLDNLLKIVLDGMNGIAYKDDNQVVSFNGSEKLYGKTPSTLVIVTPLSVQEIGTYHSGIGKNGVILR